MAIGSTSGSVTTVLTGTIGVSTIANPTNLDITAHGLQTGDSVLIAGHITAVPDINGRHVITRVDDDNLTIDVNVTTAGSGGTISEIEQILSEPTASNLYALIPQVDDMADADILVFRIYMDADGSDDYFLVADPMTFRDAQGQRSPQSGAFGMPNGGKFTVESQAGAPVTVGFILLTGE